MSPRRWVELVGLVARREIVERSRAKSYGITTAILVAAVAAAIVIPALVKGHVSTEKVGVVGASTAAVSATATEGGKVVGTKVDLVPMPDLGAAKAALQSGSVDVVLVSGKEVLTEVAPTAGTTSTAAALAGALSQLAGLQALFAHLPPAVAARASSHGVALPLRGLTQPPRRPASRFTGLFAAYVLSFTVVFGAASPADRVLAFLPPTAPVSMTALYAAGDAPAWQLALSAAICVAPTVAMARVPALVYERTILRTGRRLKLREVLRQERAGRSMSLERRAG